MVRVFFVLCIIFFFFAQASAKWLDQNGDGINDLFRDADGDGINDVTLTEYPSNFPFEDKNKDGINDLFIDEDGDGVNDWGHNRYPVLDHQNRHINDITEEPWFKGCFYGYRYGFILEEKRMRIPEFVDQNRDGMHDRIEQFMFRDRDGDGINDFFFDRNGDGINDRLKNRRRPRPIGQGPNRPLHPGRP